MFAYSDGPRPVVYVVEMCMSLRTGASWLLSAHGAGALLLTLGRCAAAQNWGVPAALVDWALVRARGETRSQRGEGFDEGVELLGLTTLLVTCYSLEVWEASAREDVLAR